MELRQLRYFVRIVELGSMTRAAADLYVAQPALSQQLAALESELGTLLLARSHRGVTPTEAGSVFYRHAQTVLRLMERMKHEVQQTGGEPTGDVSIGMPTSVANVLATPLLQATQARFPAIRLQIHEGLSGQLRELVANARIEMSMLFEAAGRDEMDATLKGFGSPVNVRPVLTEDLFLLQAGKRRFGAAVTLAAAAQLQFVLPGRANATRQIVDRCFQDAGLSLKVIAELDSLATIKSVVASGLAATVLSASALAGATGRDGVTAHRISDAQLKRRVLLCTCDHVVPGTAARWVADLAVEVSNELVRQGTWLGQPILGPDDEGHKQGL